MSVYSQFISSGKKLKVQAFTASGSWVRPIGVDAVHLFMVGGGGGGGGAYKDVANIEYFAAGGGGAGEVYQGFVDVTGVSVGSTVSVTIGSGGSGGPASNTPNGGQGGDSTFGSLVTCLGGGYGGGVSNSSTNNGGNGASGGGAAVRVTTAGSYLIQAGCGGGSMSNAVVPANLSGTIYTYVPPFAASTSKASGLATKSNGFNGGASLTVTEGNNITTPSTLYGPGQGLFFNGKGYAAGGLGAGNMEPWTNKAWGGAMSGLDAIANSGTGGNGATYTTNSIGGTVGGAGGSGYAYVSWFE